MKNYSVIWDGSENDVSQQINFITKWASAKAIPVRHWKDKTIQERVCQYVGNPKKQRAERDFKRNNISKKYTILKMSDSQMLEFKTLVGKPFTYESDEKNEYAVIDSFTAIKHTESLTNEYYFRSLKEKFNTEEEAVKEVEARLTLNPNQKRTFKCDIIRIRGTADSWKRLNEIVVTEHDSLFQPWVVLDEEGLETAGGEITKHSGVDIVELQKQEREIIEQYNALNNACGRRYSAPSDASDELKQHFANRKASEIALKDIRKELGSAKRKMTTTAKKNEGIECDLTAYSVV